MSADTDSDPDVMGLDHTTVTGWGRTAPTAAWLIRPRSSSPVPAVSRHLSLASTSSCSHTKSMRSR